MNKILITGATGFIGAAVIKQLEKKRIPSLEVHAVYHKKTPPNHEGIIWHNCDLLNAEETKNLFNNVQPSYFIHLAWCSEHGKYWKDLNNLEWVKASLQLAQNFAKNNGKRCVFIGTSAEYDWNDNAYLREGSRIKPDSLYGASKLGLYSVISQFFNQESISWAWARLFNVYGEGEDERRLIPKTCISLLNENPITLDSGLSKRDFLQVEEVAKAILSILFNFINGPVNVASGIPVSIREIVSQIATNLKKSDLVTFNDSMFSEFKENFIVADTSNLKNNFHWTPSVDLSEGLINICEWWESQKNKKSVDEKK